MMEQTKLFCLKHDPEKEGIKHRFHGRWGCLKCLSQTQQRVYVS